jgi:hypothetical protein
MYPDKINDLGEEASMEAYARYEGDSTKISEAVNLIGEWVKVHGRERGYTQEEIRRAIKIGSEIYKLAMASK